LRRLRSPHVEDTFGFLGHDGGDGSERIEVVVVGGAIGETMAW
jgi:hypothetical protein